MPKPECGPLDLPGKPTVSVHACEIKLQQAVDMRVHTKRCEYKALLRKPSARTIDLKVTNTYAHVF
jgi:hypothetical protein